MTTDITPSTFDESLDEILQKLLYARYVTGFEGVETAREAIKQLVARKVIGEPLDIGTITTQSLIDARMAQNRLKKHQLKALGIETSQPHKDNTNGSLNKGAK